MFKTIPQQLWKSGFNTHSKPVGNGESTLKYLANYVYKTAISNNRIVSLENGKVTFNYKDSKTNKTKFVKISVFEFMRRFLQHTLPKRFQRIRHYGFLSSGAKKKFEKLTAENGYFTLMVELCLNSMFFLEIQVANITFSRINIKSFVQIIFSPYVTKKVVILS